MSEPKPDYLVKWDETDAAKLTADVWKELRAENKRLRERLENEKRISSDFMHYLDDIRDFIRVEGKFEEMGQYGHTYGKLWDMVEQKEKDYHQHIMSLLDEIKRLREEVERLKEADRWIPVSERLPENNQYVLGAERSWWGPRYTAWWYHSDLRDRFVREFSHWRTMPDPPEPKP